LARLLNGLTHPEAATQYARDVVDGNILANKWLILACKRHLDDLEKSKSPDYPYTFDHKKAQKFCTFFEMMPHVEGKWAARGELLVMEPWQAFFGCSLFGWVKKADGYRRFKRVYCCVPRKNAKSTFAAVVGIYCLILDNEFGAQIYSGATSREQAAFVFNPAKKMLEMSPAICRKYGVVVNADSITVLKTNSKFTRLIGNPGDGGNPSCALVDEYHEHDDSRLYDTMTSGMGAREQPIAFVITTAGFNTSGPCYLLQKDMEKMLEGITDNPTRFALIYTVDSEAFVQSINPLPGIGLIQKDCSCGRAPNTLIKKLWEEKCVQVAIQHGKERQARNLVSTTQIDSQEIDSCAEVATNSGSLIEIQRERNAQSKSVPSGTKTTPIKSKQLGLGSQQTNPNISGIKLTLLENLDMGSLERSMTACVLSKMESAGSVEHHQTASAWITATAQMLFEDCSASNAMLQSAFLEILSKVYNEHSNTCNSRKHRLTSLGLDVDRPSMDWTSAEAVRMANPNWGVSVNVEDTLEEIAEAVVATEKQNLVKTKKLNIWCFARNGFFNVDAWNKCADIALCLEDFKGEPCVKGLDLASQIDLAADVTLFQKSIEDPITLVSDTHYYIFSKFYIPEATVAMPINQHYQKWVHDKHLISTPGDEIYLAYIRNNIVADCAEFDVKELTYDKAQATYMKQEITDETGVTGVEIPQNATTLNIPMKTLQAMIRSGRVHHNGNPVMTWCVSNVVSREDANENDFPRKERPENKIDGVSALLNTLVRVKAALGEENTEYYKYDGF